MIYPSIWRILGLLLGSVFLVISLAAQAASSTAPSPQLQAVFAQIAKPQLLRASFVQQKRLNSVNKTFKSSGQVVVAKQQGVLWLIHSPVQAQLILTAQNIVQKTANTQSKMSLSQSQYAQVANLFMQLMAADQQALAKNFQIEILNVHSAAQVLQWKIRLRPKSALFKKLFNYIDASGASDVQHIVILDLQGNSTDIVFNPQKNTAQQLSPAENALLQLAK